MYRIFIFVLTAIFVICGAGTATGQPENNTAHAGSDGIDLYQVYIRSHADAEALTETGADPIFRLGEGYLVLAGQVASDILGRSGLEYNLIASDVNRSRLMHDMRFDLANVDKYPLVFEEEGLRLFLLDHEILREEAKVSGLMPVGNKKLRIFYKAPLSPDRWSPTPRLDVDLDSLIALVSEDSLESYSLDLQEFASRIPNSGANKRCTQWIENKLLGFGYDSIVFHHFVNEDRWGDLVNGRNLLAYKSGTTYQYDQIIVGAHYDGVSESPAADDNGSGIAATVELARILSDMETNMAFIFAFWDAEELGLLGSEVYAHEAADREDRIVFNLNMDMIAYYRNDYEAAIHYDVDRDYANLWIDLADSLTGINITGHMAGFGGGSDHTSFIEAGYDAMMAHEHLFSNVYHSYRDSVDYMDFDYMRRMVMASLATAVYVDQYHIPPPKLYFYCLGELPTVIQPGTQPTITVEVEEYAGAVLLPGSVSLNYSINGGMFASTTMTNLGDNVYEAPLPLLSCGDDLAYTVSAGDVTAGGIHYFPGSSSAVWAIMTSWAEIVLEDDFQTDQGWTVGGDVTSGMWERWNASSNTDYPRFDYDHSGKCYITDHSMYEDVDNGTTSLYSPLLDVTYGKSIIEYACWFNNGTGLTGKSDVFRVYVYDGLDWILVDTIGPVEHAAGEWVTNQFWLHEFCIPTGPIQLRFDASDAGFDSHVEAAVDAVKVKYYSFGPHIFTETLPDEFIGVPYSQQLEAVACDEPITWTDKYGDLSATGLTLSEDGSLAGVPSDTGLISFTGMVQDAGGLMAEKQYSFRIWLPFICGDASMDYQLNLGDAVYLISYIFKGGPEPFPLCVADANGDDDINVGDVVFLINYIFNAGPVPLEGCCL
jgi:hypothetical protein